MMKLAYRVLIVSLFCFSIVAAAFAQTAVSTDKSKRSAKDDRNIAPTFGTGGAMGGPTGLFTVYDAQTLRRGEYTFSAAYSNFDRDPGDVDITEVPLSFQIGVTNNFELFFNTDGYRAVKVNSPGNLSGFYLPDSTLNGVNPAAIVLGTGGYSAVFRPVNSIPFSRFPYPTTTGSGSGASLFPGVGSVYGGILPGIVFQTAAGDGFTYPTSFTTAPSYLPDAPFLNRTYGESAFSTFTVGGKVRFNNVNDWWGVGLVAAYRFYADDANDFSGFNQLQRGASAGGGGGILGGDILVTGVFDGRVRKWWNISANIGYHWNRDVKSDAYGSDVTLLDRPDEFLLSAGMDFPVNRYFQPIVEFRSTHYVGGHTPNAFENDPYEALVGVRIFPARWFGFSAGYRYHFNQQDRDSFDDDDTYTLTTYVPCIDVIVGEGGTECSAAYIPVTRTVRGIPPGFRTSSDPHGFFGQVFIGRRNKRLEDKVNGFADVTGLTVSDSQINLGCAPGYAPRSGVACNESTSVSVSTTAVDPENDVLTYNYTVSGGRIVGTGSNVSWDLSGAQPGTYTITAAVDDGCGLCGKTQTQTVTVAACPDCVKLCDCPSLSVSGPAGIVNPGDAMTFTATLAGGTQDNVTYNWSVSAGTIESGQGTPSITVRTTSEMANSSVTATVEIGGLPADCDCPRTANETGSIAPNPEFVKIDEFGKIPNDDIRSRLDTFFAELANNPSNQGYIINYGTPKEVAAREKLITNHIAFRRFDRSRITLVNGGASPDGVVTTKLYRIPPGAQNPTP